MKEEPKKKKKNKETFTELQKLNADEELYSNSKKCDWIYTHTHIYIHP